jgi:hypothetical protein
MVRMTLDGASRAPASPASFAAGPVTPRPRYSKQRGATYGEAEGRPEEGGSDCDDPRQQHLCCLGLATLNPARAFGEEDMFCPALGTAEPATLDSNEVVAGAVHAAIPKKSLAVTKPSVTSMILHITAGSGTRPSFKYLRTLSTLTPIF